MSLEEQDGDGGGGSGGGSGGGGGAENPQTRSGQEGPKKKPAGREVMIKLVLTFAYL